MSSYRDSRAFGAIELETFLRAVDRHLSRKASLVIIGGGAAALMKYLVGDERRARANFLQLIERLFGELKRVSAEKLLRAGGGT